MIKVLTYKEVIALLESPMEARTKALIAFQYASGCRIGELLDYQHTDGSTTKGLLKSNVKIDDESISWEMPNFKVADEKKKLKYPFILKEEGVLWNIIYDWMGRCGEQVFELKQSRARDLIREQIQPHSSHALRRSRGTHLADTFGYNVYEIMDALGHTKMESSLAYVSAASRKSKMKKALERIISEKDENIP